MRILKATITGEPIAKGRPQFFGGHAVTPAKTRKAEERTAEEWIRQAGAVPLIGSVKMDIAFFLETPKSWSRKQQAAANRREIRPVKRPDLDNLIKLIQDALNGIAYHDDKQIQEITARKYYSAKPRTVITVSDLPAEEEQLMIEDVAK